MVMKTNKNILLPLLGVSALGLFGMGAAYSQVVTGTQDFSITVQDTVDICDDAVPLQTTCTDGSTFVGWVGDDPLYVRNLGTYTWATSNISVPGSLTNSGQTNTAAMAAVDPSLASFPGLSACKALGAAYFLPSIEEVNQIWSNIPLEDRGDYFTNNSFTMTSNSWATNVGFVASFISRDTSYLTQARGKTALQFVRCARTRSGVPDNYPDDFTLTSAANLASSPTGAPINFNTFTVSGIDTSIDVNVSGAGSPRFRINDGPIVTSGTLSAGDTVTVLMTSSADFGTMLTATLTLGMRSKDFSVTTLEDATPDAFLFADLIDQAPDADIISAAVTPTGFSRMTVVPEGGISISVKGGVFQTVAQSVSPGDTLVARVRTSVFAPVSYSGDIVFYGAPGAETYRTTWSVASVAPAGQAVDAFNLNWEYSAQSYSGTVPGVKRQSNIITVSGDTGFKRLRVLDVQGNYQSGSTNNWPRVYGTRIDQLLPSGSTTNRTVSLTSDSSAAMYTTLDSFTLGTYPGQQIAIHAVPAVNSGETYSILCVASSCSEYIWTNSATRSDPRAADAFDMADVTGADTGTLYVSDPFTVSWDARTAGAQAPNIPISVSGNGTPQYRVNGGSWTNVTGWVKPGSTVEVRQTSAAVAGTDRTATLSVGTTTSDYVVRTFDVTTPDAFTLAAVTGSGPNVEVTSAPVTITGISASVPVSVTGTGSPQLTTNGGVTWATTGTVAPNGSVQVRLTSAPAYETARTATLDVNGVTGTFSVTTGEFIFAVAAKTNVQVNSLITSNPVTMPAYLTASSISVSGDGSPSYSIDGGVFTSAPGTISGDQVLRVRLTSDTVEGGERVASVSIGAASASFSTTTSPPDPCTTGPVGTTCFDGAIFAGVANGERIYINDATQTSLAFMSSFSGYVPAFYDRGIENQSFTLAAKGSLSSFPAMAHCAGLSSGGRDFYLPSNAEMQVIHANRAFLSSTLILSGFGDQYWSSNIFQDGDYDRSGEFDMGTGFSFLDPDELSDSGRSVICVAYGPSVTPIDPCSGTPSSGDYCVDGSIYVGQIGGVPRYTTLTDPIGTRQAKTSSTATVGTTSSADGLANTDAMIAAGSAAHPAAAACRALGSEWYLPALSEMALMKISSAPLLEVTWASTLNYWSSTQATDNRRNFRYDPTSNTQGDATKITSSNVRCMKR